MELETKYKLELTEKEAIALKILLGAYSYVEKKQLGLDDDDCTSTSELYDLLPYDEKAARTIEMNLRPKPTKESE